MKGLLDKINAKLNAQGGFFKAVSVLVGGAALGQLIAILALPLLTRLYSPQEFSTLAIYTSILSLITVIACMRFEVAIPIPKLDLIAAALFVLSIISVLVITSISVFIIIFLLKTDLDISSIESLIWFIPVGVLLVGVYNALQYWSTRNKKFALISKTRITQSLSGTSVKIGSGYMYSGSAIGLVIGQLLSQGAGFFSLLLSLIKNDLKTFKSLKFWHLKLAMKRYDKFPKYSTLEALANTAGYHVPILLIAYFMSGPEVGYLMMAIQLLLVPMGLLGSSVAQVYLTEGSLKFHNGNLKKFTYKTIMNLVKLFFLPLFFIGVFSPILVPYILGDNWVRTGMLISWMIPWFFMQFITSPISMALHITGNQKIAFLLQILGCILRVSCVFFAIKYMDAYVSEVYAISGFIFYSIYLFIVLLVLNSIEKNEI